MKLDYNQAVPIHRIVCESQNMVVRESQNMGQSLQGEFRLCQARAMLLTSFKFGRNLTVNHLVLPKHDSISSQYRSRLPPSQAGTINS